MGMNWIRESRADSGSGVVVFIHGVLSDAKVCFLGESGISWPELLAQEAEFSDAGILEFEYKTSVRGFEYSVLDAAKSLEQFVDDFELPKYPWIVFVAHSMGGIVARQYVVKANKTLREHKTRIGMFLVASPSKGSFWANILETIAPVAHAQRDALRIAERGGYLDVLNDDFRRKIEEKEIEIVGKELIETKALHLLWGLIPLPATIVGDASASVFFEGYRVRGVDHISIAKPSSNQAEQHVVLRNFLRKDLFSQREVSVEAPVQNETPRPPTAYHWRPSVDGPLYTLVQSASLGPKRRRVLALLGPSGVGKTSAMLQHHSVAHAAGAEWYDCKFDFQLRPSLLKSKLIFVDNLTPNHPLWKEEFLGKCTGAIVLATRDKLFAEQVLGSFGLLNTPDSFLSLGNFSTEEVREFLRKSYGTLSAEASTLVAEVSQGTPVILQIFRALLAEFSTVEELRQLCPSGNCDDLIRLALKRWFAEKDVAGETLESVVECLSTATYAGMTEDALAQTLDKQRSDISRALNTLSSANLLYSFKSPQGKNTYFALPPPIRSSFEEAGSTRRYHKKYLAALLKRIDAGGVTTPELFDAWLAGWHSVFFELGASDVSGFEARFQRHLDVLNSLESQGAQLNEFVETTLTLQLQQRCIDLGAEGCAFVIGLARFLRVTALKKTHLRALHILPGAYNGDSWARAASIQCAADHWLADAQLGKIRVRKYIGEWVDEALKQCHFESRLASTAKYWGNVPDLDFLSAAGAFDRAGNPERVAEIVRDPVFRGIYPHFTLTDCFFLACVALRGHLPNDAQMRALAVVTQLRAGCSSAEQCLGVLLTTEQGGDWLKQFQKLQRDQPPLQKEAAGLVLAMAEMGNLQELEAAASSQQPSAMRWF